MVELARYRFARYLFGLLSLVLLFATVRQLALAAPAVAGEAVHLYLADQIRNFRAYGGDTARHPGSVVQNTLGYVLSLGTVGERGQGAGGTWVYYENASGLGVLIPKLFGTEAITIGNFAFSEGPLRSNRSLYWHEYRHYQQSTDLGLLFLPTYLINNITHGYRDNPLERDAQEWGRRLRRQPVT